MKAIKSFNSLFYLLLTFCFTSCILANGERNVYCSKSLVNSQNTIDKKLESFWENHPENRFDYQTIHSIINVNPTLLLKSMNIDSIDIIVDSIIKLEIERRYIKIPVPVPNSDPNIFWYFKSNDNKKIYLLKSYCRCENSSEVCSFCLRGVMNLPVNLSSKWQDPMRLPPKERKEIRRLFKQDVVDKLDL